MSQNLLRPLLILSAVLALAPLTAYQSRPATARHLTDPFSAGWMLVDTNGDSIADVVAGKIVVPANPSAEENAAAANLGARVAYGSTGLTPPVVITSAADDSSGPRIYVGRDAVPARHAAAVSAFTGGLQAGEGGVLALEGDIALLGDAVGLTAAANAYAARAPFVWRPSGERLAGLAGACGAEGQLTAVTYLHGRAGIQRAFLDCPAAATQQQLGAALNTPALANVHQLIAGGMTATSSHDLPAIPAAPAGTASAATGAPDAAPAGGADAETGPARLDLATLYTMRGLFRGTPRMPIPSNLDGQLYVPAGTSGVAMANLAARMGLETTGISLPLATAAAAVAPREIRTKSVVEVSSAVGKEAERKSAEEDTASGHQPPLQKDEGELRIVDKAFGRQPAVLVRGTGAGSEAALRLLGEHFPNLWEPGKQFATLEEVRYDLHRFFSLRSSAGQAAFALYRLDKWAGEVKKAGPARNVEVKVFVDVADGKLGELVRSRVESELGTRGIQVETRSLHAGTQCCQALPALHYREPGYEFRPGTPAFQEDIVIPWEGKRLLQAVNGAVSKLSPGQPVKLMARVSEGPEQRQKLKRQLQDMIAKAGAKGAEVQVICAYKPGVSWLMDEIAPRIKGKAASIKIEFRKNTDAGGTRAMYSPARWVHELYPVDELLAKELGIPLEKITLDQFEGAPTGPTYRVHAFDAAGKEMLTREFTVTTVEAPYNGVMPEYENVEVDTGWVRMESGATVVLNARIATDIEQFWEHYHKVTLPKVFKTVMASYHGELRPEFAPPFDTLKLDIHMSEPDYELGIDKERISSLEALQEDTFYSTENFVNMMGDLEAGRAVQYAGRIIPIVHASQEGQDGRVHIEFYAKPAGGPKVELRWTDAQGKRHERTRDMWALSGSLQPRLIAARAHAGESGPESLTWLLPADFKDDDYEKWVEVEGKDQVERSILSAEQARAQLTWLAQMHTAGMYRDEIAYPHVKWMDFEFELPLPLSAKVDAAAPREYASIKVDPPASKRPMIADFAAPLNRPDLVQWDEPISPAENARVLAALAKRPGVNVYWMGRSYLGENIWAADITLPTPSTLRSWAKETTLKASIVYSGRQHANEVSSTSHILRLGDLATSDPATKAELKQVNVVLHPITNPDGAELSVQLAEITPNNMLHPGYHGALAADVSVGQTEIDPVYPESRTRRLLLEQWLPDAFLNPHGYPSHEWVQPFSEYSGWVTNRQGANNGRTWWIPRGWFTSLTYLRDETHPYSPKVTYELRDRIVKAERAVPGLLALEDRMNARYQRFGQRWQPENMQQPIVDGIRIYMSLKGSAGGGRGGAAGAGAGAAAPGSGGVGGISPDVTWDSGYTEAPDETAHGDYMKLMASAGLAFDRVHLDYMANGKLRITSSVREQAGKVTWRVERLRPNLPAGETEPPRPGAATEGNQ